jgi:hypothetical protein
MAAVLRRRLAERRRNVEAEQLRHVFDLGRSDSQPAERVRNSRVVPQERPPDDLLASDDLDQLALERRASTPAVLTPRISARISGPGRRLFTR